MIGLIKGTARQIKTVSGLPLPIASYKSNSKAPLKELSLSINPTQSGSGDPAPDNIRPITGVSSVNVARTGKNLFDKSEFQNLRTSYEYVDDSYYCRSIQLLPNTTYTVSQNAGSTSSVIILINATSHVNDIGYFDLRKASDVKTFTTDNSGKLYIGVHIYTTDTQYNERLEQCKVQIELGSTPSDYEAYQGNTYLIQLGDTYYGGELYVDEDGNVKFGVTKQVIDKTYFPSMSVYFNTEAGIVRTFYLKLPDNYRASDTFINSNYFTPRPLTSTHAYDCEVTASSAHVQKIYFSISNVDYPNMTAAEAKQFLIDNDVQFEFNFATPIEIDLGNLSIPSLLGQNNIWHDGNGDVEVLKFMDRQLYFGR